MYCEVAAKQFVLYEMYTQGIPCYTNSSYRTAKMRPLFRQSLKTINDIENVPLMHPLPILQFLRRFTNSHPAPAVAERGCMGRVE